MDIIEMLGSAGPSHWSKNYMCSNRSKQERLQERSGFNTSREMKYYEELNAQQPVTTYNLKDLQA